MQTFGAKVFADSRGKSLQTLEVITIQSLNLRKFRRLESLDSSVDANKEFSKDVMMDLMEQTISETVQITLKSTLTKKLIL